MSEECRRDDSFVTAIAHCHGDAGEANGDGSQRGRGKWFFGDAKGTLKEPFSPSPLAPRTIFPVPIGLVIYHIL